MASQDFQNLHNITAEINADHEAISKSRRETRERAISIGRKLIEVKRQLGHGGFMPYVKAKLTFSHRTATEYTGVARHEVFVRKLEEASNLGEASLSAVLAKAKELRKQAEGRLDEVVKAILVLAERSITPAEFYALRHKVRPEDLESAGTWLVDAQQHRDTLSSQDLEAIDLDEEEADQADSGGSQSSDVTDLKAGTEPSADESEGKALTKRPPSRSPR